MVWKLNVLSELMYWGHHLLVVMNSLGNVAYWRKVIKGSLGKICSVHGPVRLLHLSFLAVELSSSAPHTHIHQQQLCSPHAHTSSLCSDSLWAGDWVSQFYIKTFCETVKLFVSSNSEFRFVTVIEKWLALFAHPKYGINYV